MRIYLAAVSQFYGDSSWDPENGPAEIHRILLSYMPTWKDNAKMLKALNHSSQPKDYCIDSGAHVWLSDFFKNNKKADVGEVRETLSNFIQAVKRMPRKPSFVVELDLQKIYGLEVVEKWRETLWKPFEAETGIKVCYVWHQVDGFNRWMSMLADPDIHYLGMGSDRSLDLDIRAALVYKAYKAAKPVHGFASVDARWMKQVPFYSVDSTSWAVGAQVFGLASRFDPQNGKIKQLSVGNRAFRDDPRQAAANLVRSGNFHPSDILERKDGKKNYSRFYTAAGSVFKDHEEWHTAYWKSKGLDWDKQLRKARNVPPGLSGGYLKVDQVR